MEVPAGSLAGHFYGTTWSVGIPHAPMHFGPVSFCMRFDAATSLITGEARLTTGREPSWLKLHIRVPQGKSLKLIQGPILEGDALCWQAPKGQMRFSLNVS